MHVHKAGEGGAAVREEVKHLPAGEATKRVGCIESRPRRFTRSRAAWNMAAPPERTPDHSDGADFVATLVEWYEARGALRIV